MTEPLSVDLRERVLAAVEKGGRRRAVAAQFGIAASTVTKWVKHVSRTGSPTPSPQGGDRRSARIETHAQDILGLVEKTPDITLDELVAHLVAQHGQKFAVSTVWRCLDRHGISFKKNSTRRRAGAGGRRGRA